MKHDPSIWTRWTAYVHYARFVMTHGMQSIIQIAPTIWWITALIWGLGSYTLLHEVASRYDLETTRTFWMFCSLMWAQFGMAGAFVAFRNQNQELFINRLLIALLPPLTLHFIIFSLNL